jgi:hypothetical protein
MLRSIGVSFLHSHTFLQASPSFLNICKAGLATQNIFYAPRFPMEKRFSCGIIWEVLHTSPPLADLQCTLVKRECGANCSGQMSVSAALLPASCVRASLHSSGRLGSYLRLDSIASAASPTAESLTLWEYVVIFSGCPPRSISSYLLSDILFCSVIYPPPRTTHPIGDTEHTEH